jgi:hypothetical protein
VHRWLCTARSADLRLGSADAVLLKAVVKSQSCQFSDCGLTFKCHRFVIMQSTHWRNFYGNAAVGRPDFVSIVSDLVRDEAIFSE